MEGKENEFYNSIQEIINNMHELSQPVSILFGELDLLLIKLNNNHSIIQEINLINKQLEKILALILKIQKNLLDLQKKHEK